METVPAAARPRKAKKIPAYLIYEEMDGKPIYRKGYKSVLNKSKTLEDIMGSILEHLQKRGIVLETDR